MLILGANMIPKAEIDKILGEYDKGKVKLAVICSHSALQIFHGARQEGIKTIGICKRKNQERYEAFPLAKPDEYIFVDRYEEIADRAGELVAKNAILIPHGSAVEYIGKKVETIKVPIFGNRRVLLWEADRQKMLKWLAEAGVKIPKTYSPSDIQSPAIVKFPGARGGKGYFVVNNTKEFNARIAKDLKAGKISQADVDGVVVQEFLSGVRFYPHYFYTPFFKDGFKCQEGRLEMLGLDKRIESNIDEIYRPLVFGVKAEPSYTVVGNAPVIMRESLLDDVLGIGKRVVDASFRLFGGIYGPFCVETIIDENFNITAFEVSARIVAGTNLYPQGSQYSCYIFDEQMSTGRRIAREIKTASQKDALAKVVY